MRVDNKVCRRRLDEDQVGLIVEVFRMLSDATRVQLLWALVDRESSVTELAETVGKPAASVSHLRDKVALAAWPLAEATAAALTCRRPWHRWLKVWTARTACPTAPADLAPAAGH